MAKQRLATRPFEDELPELLAGSGLTVRGLAREAGVGHDHLSRVLRRARGRRVSGELAARIAVVLSLRDDFFLETRLARVVEKLERDPVLLERVYSRYVSGSR